MDEFEKKRTIFVARLHNVEVDDWDMSPTQDLTAVGLHFDLRNSRFRISPAWIDARRAERSLDVHQRSVREWLVLFGGLIWPTYARDVPLWTHWCCMRALATMLRVTGGNFDAAYHMPEEDVVALRRWVDAVLDNPWTVPRTAPSDWKSCVFSDASSTGGGFVEIAEGAILRAGGWERHDDAHISAAEAAALVASAACRLWTTHRCI